MPFRTGTDVVSTVPTPSGGEVSPSPTFRGSATTTSPNSTADTPKEDFWVQDDLLDRGIKSVVPPVANMLDFPIRDLGSRLVAAVTAGLPTDDASRDAFYDKHAKYMSATEIPENETGKGISKALSFPGQMVGRGAELASNAVLGENVTKAISPYVGALADVAPAGLGKLAKDRSLTARTVETTPTPQAFAARAAGYKLPPEEIMAHPSLPSRLMAGEAGAVKRRQAFSRDNQNNTNQIAARAIGLPADTRLGETAFARARQPAEQVYSNLTHSVPETILGADQSFQQAIASVGSRSAELERFFPEAGKNPSIAKLREELSQNLAAPTDVVRRKIADLRRESSSNFKKYNDAEANSLGLAQKQGANVLEDAIERSIMYGPKMVDTMRDWAGASQAVKDAQAEITKATATGLPPHPSLVKNLSDAQRREQQYSQQLNIQHAAITPTDVEKARVLLGAFKDARQLFAKIYDVEEATNLPTGDVISRRLSGLRRTKDKPLTGGLKDIADFHDAFEKQSQSPHTYGQPEDFSILDIIAAAGALTSGHPGLAAVVAGRSPVRSALRSEPMQKRMFNRPLPLTNPSSATLYGTVGRDTGTPEEDPLAGLLRESDTLRGIGR